MVIGCVRLTDVSVIDTIRSSQIAKVWSELPVRSVEHGERLELILTATRTHQEMRQRT